MEHRTGRAAGGRRPGRPEEQTMMNWIVVLIIWAVMSAGLVLWFGKALAAFEAPHGPRRDTTACACCRHDAVAHEHGEPGDRCTQCPCDGFRSTC
jgi:hypothetical protein